MLFPVGINAKVKKQTTRKPATTSRAHHDGSKKQAAPSEKSLCPDENHPHMIDLGLPSGTKWACCNVGAKSPTDYGDHFAWGETETKSDYSWGTYKWSNDYYELTKYCTDIDLGFVDNKPELDLDDDAAYVNWGSGWRMPSREQLEELHANCTSKWTKINGVRGYLLKSKRNGASLFLPAAGVRPGSSLEYAGSVGDYWSRTLETNDPQNAFSLEGLDVTSNNGDRSDGRSVRAVCVP